MNTNKNILEEANQIVNNRSQESDRQYGPFSEGMDNCAQMTSLLSRKEITTIDVFNVLISLKLTRQSYSHKRDNLMDCVAYISGMDNYINEINLKPQKIDENENIKKLYRDLYYHGEEIEVRGLKTKELQNYQIIFKPYQRFINFPSRKLSLKYIKDELMWYFNSDFSDLSICDHAKIWKNLVNDDKTIYSNYGAIIFNGNFERIIKTLCNDKYSRRAVIMIGDNDNLNDEETNDCKCTNSIVFSIRNNKLEMFVHMRSNDAIFGLCNDVPFFSILHEMVYVVLKNVMYEDLIYGNYTHYANSLHVYERHYNMLKKIVLLDEDIIEIDCPKISCVNEVEFIKEIKFTNDVYEKSKKYKSDSEDNPKFSFIEWLLKN